MLNSLLSTRFLKLFLIILQYRETMLSTVVCAFQIQSHKDHYLMDGIDANNELTGVNIRRDYVTYIHNELANMSLPFFA